MKFGIIGTNFVSDYFMSGALECPDCEVVAVSATSLEKANNFADKYAIPHRFDNYEKMAEAGVIDAVYVATPNGKHLAHSKFFLERKIPVFCEKPLAGNLKEVEEMIACAQTNNTYLQEGLIPIYNPTFAALQEARKALGPIRQVTLNFSKYSSRYDAYLAGENPTTFRSELANGAIMDLGVYPIGLCVCLFGKPVKILSASSLLETKADISGTSIFGYDDFNVAISYSKASDTENLSEICGEAGIITIDVCSTLSNVYFIDRKTKEKTRIGGDLKPNFYYQIKDMIENISNGLIESTRMTFEKSKAVHEAITECRRQAGIVYPCDLD